MLTLLLAGFLPLAAQTITGRVTNGGDGSSLPGVSVLLKGTTTGTTTDSEGTYTINVEEPTGTLVFSFIGYTTQEIQTNNRTTIDVVLQEDITQLGEVVITALGIEKSEKALGYAVTSVSGDRLTQSREINIGSALTGMVPGVNVAGLGTGPTGSSRITIRGNSSLQGNNQPLYVIDGVPFDNANQGSSGQWGGADYGDGLSNINPDNIESLQVLKGVAATSLYGFRGGNGVILITTKSGARSKGLGVEVNNNMTFNSVIDEREYQYQYGQGTQGVKPVTVDAARGTTQSSWGALLDGSDAVNFLGNNYSYLPAKDNFKNFYRTGVTNQASLALTSSGEFGNFRLGLTDMRMKTPIPNSSMDQQGINFNGTFNVTPKLQASLSANYVFENVKNRASFSDAPGSVLAGPLYLANSFDIRWMEPTTDQLGNELLPGDDIYFNNSYFVAYKYQNATSRNRLTAALGLKYDFTDWLSLKGQVTRDGYIFDQRNIVPSGTGYRTGGSITQYKTDYHEINANFMITVNKMFGDFGVVANLGSNTQDNIWERSGVDGAGPFLIPFFYSTSNTTNRAYDYGYTHYRVNSIYGSVDLSYKSFLYLTLTSRNDWFSTLNINSNSYQYPSASASFVFSEVLNMPSWISFGKLRASYGQSSNGTTPYRNLLTYGLHGYTISGQSLGYINQNQIPNSLLEPVKISEQEVGVNIEFFNNRLGLDVAYYNKTTKDDILGVTVSPTSGYSGNVANVGELRNRGIEVLLTGTPIKTPNFSWDASFNIASNDNEVMAISEGVDNIVIDGAFPRFGDGVSVQHIVGERYGQIVGYKYLLDENGNRVYGEDGLPLRSERVEPLGSGVYNVTGGFNNSFTYKNFNLSFLFDFKYGAKIYSGTNLSLYSRGLHKETLNGREGGIVGAGVTEEGNINTINVDPQIYYQGISTGANHISEEFVYDASFIKLRALSLGYTIPQSVLSNFFIKSASISFVARNLATLMKHTPNIDPESNLNNTNGQGLELTGYPAMRSYGFNVNLKF